ncbi:hypothetical protein H5410_009843 [Solanum commersonii]|uniref:Yippee domain-containing protein n=1 Tax=Solanum commersonii TaxID=4109 RepID=A0A9J6AJK3_SOLCO|nr:hypothetical protein H5410_009843 [Solanum commersonii]
MKCYSVQLQDVIPLYHTIHCRRCGNQVARTHDYIRLWPKGLFHRVFNVVVRDNVKNHQRLLGTAVAKANCVQCGVTLGWKYIEVTPQNSLIREGKFLMILKKLCLWNDVLLLRIKKVQDLHTYEENADQDGDMNEENVDQDGDTNEENVDQDEDTNEHEVGANEQNVDQGGGGNELNHEEDVGVIRFNVRNFLTHFINKNAYQGGGGNELNHEQDVAANEQNAAQDGGANEQNADQDGGANEQDDVNDHLQQDVNTLANTSCVRCGTLLGWKFIAVPEPSMIIRAGRFCMRLMEEIPDDCDSIYCGGCRTRVAFIEDVFVTMSSVGIFDRVFNVEVSYDVNNHHQQDENTLANTYCVQCGRMLGWKFDMLSFEEQNVDQDVGGNQQVPIEQEYQDGDGDQQVPHEQDLSANEQNADQDRGGDQQVPNEQDLGTNEQNVDQDGGSDPQVPNEQDYQDRGGDQQVPIEQDLGANEQSVDQDGGGDQEVPNEQNDDQDGGGDEQNYDPDGRDNQQAPNEHDLGTNEQNDDQDGGSNGQECLQGCLLQCKYHAISTSCDFIYCLIRHICRFSVQVAEDYRITVPQPSSSHTVGRFVMILNRLVCWNNVTLLDLLLEGNNEQAPNDQDGGADEEQDHDQNGGANEQVPNEQDLGSNEQNADQNGDANEQNVDQDGDANEQDLGSNEQNADLDGNGGINEQVPNQDTTRVIINQKLELPDKLTFSNHIPLLRSIEEQIEKNADQDGDAAGQDLGVNEKNDGDANEQEVGANEKNANQDGGSNEQNHDQHRGAPMN